jgi:integrase/recombinase XerD
MRRESVATLRADHLDGAWGLRGVRVKGGKTRDIPLPAAVMQFMSVYVEHFLVRHVERIDPDTPLFWSSWGRRGVGKTKAPMTGKNVWRLCKVYGRMIGYPELNPHDLRHGVAMEVLEQQHDLEQVRALLGHARIDTTQIYASIRPPPRKRGLIPRGALGSMGSTLSSTAEKLGFPAIVAEARGRAAGSKVAAGGCY